MRRGQVAADDVLLGHEVLAAHHAEVEHRHDVRVDQAGLHPRLVDELRDRLLLARQLGAQPLEDEVAREALDAGRLGDEELGHPALAQAVDQLVAPEDGADVDRRPGAGAATAGRRPPPCGLRMLTAFPSVIRAGRSSGEVTSSEAARSAARGRAGVTELRESAAWRLRRERPCQPRGHGALPRHRQRHRPRRRCTSESSRSAPMLGEARSRWRSRRDHRRSGRGRRGSPGGRAPAPARSRLPERCAAAIT